jgi:5-(carboxyamino)imidazole ribonucleotide synthase
MCNILGHDGYEGKYKPVQLIQKDGVYLKMYGKDISKPQRKLGHFNVVSQYETESMDQLLEVVDMVKNSISIEPLD